MSYIYYSRISLSDVLFKFFFFSYTKINQGYLLVKPLYIDRKGSFKGFTPQPDLKWVCGSQCKMS